MFLNPLPCLPLWLRLGRGFLNKWFWLPPELLQHFPANYHNAFTYSLTLQFQMNPQTFLVGGITFLAAIQFLSLGFIALQNKRYFEELFHLGTSLKKQNDKLYGDKNL